MIIRWKNCTSETVKVYVDRFSGEPDYIVRPTYEAQVELPDEDEEHTVHFTVHLQHNKAVFMVEKKKKPKPKA